METHIFNPKIQEPSYPSKGYTIYTQTEQEETCNTYLLFLKYLNKKTWITAQTWFSPKTFLFCLSKLLDLTITSYDQKVPLPPGQVLPSKINPWNPILRGWFHQPLKSNLGERRGQKDQRKSPYISKVNSEILPSQAARGLRSLGDVDPGSQGRGKNW